MSAFSAADVEACLDAAAPGYQGLAAVHWRAGERPTVRAVLEHLAAQGRLSPVPLEHLLEDFAIGIAGELRTSGSSYRELAREYLAKAGLAVNEGER